jgi:hypothetical protein
MLTQWHIPWLGKLWWFQIREAPELSLCSPSCVAQMNARYRTIDTVHVQMASTKVLARILPIIPSELGRSLTRRLDGIAAPLKSQSTQARPPQPSAIRDLTQTS